MRVTLEALAVVLLIAAALGMIRITLGPTSADRMLASMLFGTVGVALTLVFGALEDMPTLIDMAIVFAILTSVTSVAFVERAWGAGDR